MKFVTVILAAGKGKRMKNPGKAKVMFELHGKPMIQYVVELSLEIGSAEIILIIGHQKNSIIEFVGSCFKSQMRKIKYAFQDQQLGTGHALMQTFEYLKDFKGEILILSGDVPLLKSETINKFINLHNSKKFIGTLISSYFENPYGYGRIIRDSEGNFIDIREEKDATEEEKKIKEINSGIYIIKGELLFEALNTINNDNAQGEYYLTDVFNYFIRLKLPVGAYPVSDSKEITGVNTIDQLNEMEKLTN